MLLWAPAEYKVASKATSICSLCFATFISAALGKDGIGKVKPAVRPTTLPHLQERFEFQAADTRFRGVMKAAERNPEVLTFTDTQGLLADLEVRRMCCHRGAADRLMVRSD